MSDLYTKRFTCRACKGEGFLDPHDVPCHWCDKGEMSLIDAIDYILHVLEEAGLTKR